MQTGRMCVGPSEIMEDWNCSKDKAYKIIKQLNEQLKQEHPGSIIIAGKVNRKWYNEHCMLEK